jgi:glycosyltransferase involved in cell wall biosynthesis
LRPKRRIVTWNGCGRPSSRNANPNKNFISVLRALEAPGNDAPPCVIVGRTDQRQFADVEIDAGRVTHLGYVSDEDLLALYRRALCLVFPSFYEGFGLPPLGAMAAGCPVIASRTSAMPEISGPVAEYCDPHDYRTLVRAISRIASTPDRRSVMIEQGLRRAGKFSWQASAGRVLRILSATAGDVRCAGARCSTGTGPGPGKPARD